MSDNVAPMGKAVLERKENAPMEVKPTSEKMPLELLEVQALRDRIYAETGQRSFRDDPMFAYASISRAHLEAMEAMLKKHEAAVVASMEQRVTAYTNLMNEALHKLREEALVENLREKLVLMQNLTSENTKICDRMEDLSRFNKKILKLNFITCGVCCLTVTTAFLLFITVIK